MKGEKFVDVVVVVRVVVVDVSVVVVDSVSIRQNKVFLLFHNFLLKTFEKVGAAISLFSLRKNFMNVSFDFNFVESSFSPTCHKKTPSCCFAIHEKREIHTNISFKNCHFLWQ